MFALEDYLREGAARVEWLLEERSRGWAESVPARLFEAMRYSLLGGGKRLRPLLCLAFADASARSSGGGGRVAEDAACALEMIHTYSLIHDDLPAMDDDDLRRGKPTSHKVFGEALAILAGDALLTESFRLLGSGEEAVRLRLCGELAAGAGPSGMVGGQVLDVAEDRPAEPGYLMRLHRLKTGALIRAACRMGVLAGGGGPGELEKATAYGEAVGLAFQIVDDLLDVSGTQEMLGKPSAADAAAGRFTFPAVLGVEASRALAGERVRAAVGALEGMGLEPGPLTALARYVLERKT